MPKEKSLPKPLSDLPAPEKDLPLPRPQVPEHNDGGQAEKELTSGKNPDLASQGVDLQGRTLKSEKPAGRSSVLKYFLLGILFVILIVLIGGSAFFLGKNSALKNQQTVQTQVSALSPAPDTTADWQTYEGNGFTFKYPSYWKSINQTKRFKNSIKGLMERESFSNGKDTIMTLYVYSLPFEEKANDFNDSVDKSPIGDLGQFETSITTVTRTEDKLDGVTIIKGDFISKSDTWPEIANYYMILIPLENSSIELTAPDSKNKDIVNKVLSTFKFTDSAALSPAPTGAMAACTMETKLCSDGVTSVGRSGPNCEFEKCPGE